ncbi:Metal-dependent hydrolase, composite domain protein [Niveomyces insectorum RCEF 264]|uniref:Metal-dependent hydrolase, composite domain protein n=1 Tax=Niveomyces insectorum RCEF 264 TaxID=1081102 RepID=A0A167P565_9HYPO|nr:Metal-dependent hydrolase, composite domain protein [Niveomyces insectorum RCEF 264]
MARSWLFRNAMVVSVDKAIGTVHNCDVLVEDGTITRVGRGLVLPSTSEGVEEIDASNAILSPGFVDTHRHMWQTQLRTIAGDYTLTDYIVNIRNRYGSTYTPDDVFLGNLCGALESLEAGTTCILDHSHIMNSPQHADASIAGLRASRIRGVFCYGLYGNPVAANPAVSKGTALPESREETGKNWRLNDAARVRKEAFSVDNAATDLLRFGFAPTEVERVPVPQSLDELQYGRSLGAALVTAHVSLGKYNRGTHFVRQLAERQLLGPDLVFSHGSTLATDELEAIGKAGASLSSTPDTELQMGMGFPVAFAAEAHGCTASIGIDIVSNNASDMFAQMRLLLQAQRYAKAGDQPPPPSSVAATCADVLRIATLGGATAMGLSHLTGSITPGKRADLVLTRCDSLRLTPVHDPTAALVLYANASDVDSVFVDGVRVKDGGKLLPPEDRPDLAWPVLRERLRDSARGIMERSKLIPLSENENSVRQYFKLGK